jgi:hypothetical protein
MTKALEAALKEVAKLSPVDQDALAEAILAEIRTEKAWEHSFDSSQRELAQLADEALGEHRTGRTKPLDPKAL